MTAEYSILREVGRLLRECRIVEDRVYECRGDSVTEGRLPALDLTLYETTPIELGRSSNSGATKHELDVRVDIYVRAISPELDGSALGLADSIIDEVHRTLLADRTLGGRCALIQAGQRRWNKVSANGLHLQVEQYFRVIHATVSSDLSKSLGSSL